MDEQTDADERAYWAEQVESRQADLTAAERRGEPAHVLAGLRLRLQEADGRIKPLDRSHARGDMRDQEGTR